MLNKNYKQFWKNESSIVLQNDKSLQRSKKLTNVTENFTENMKI